MKLNGTLNLPLDYGNLLEILAAGNQSGVSAQFSRSTIVAPPNATTTLTVNVPVATNVSVVYQHQLTASVYTPLLLVTVQDDSSLPLIDSVPMTQAITIAGAFEPRAMVQRNIEIVNNDSVGITLTDEQQMVTMTPEFMQETFGVVLDSQLDAIRTLARAYIEEKEKEAHGR